MIAPAPRVLTKVGRVRPRTRQLCDRQVTLTPRCSLEVTKTRRDIHKKNKKKAEEKLSRPI